MSITVKDKFKAIRERAAVMTGALRDHTHARAHGLVESFLKVALSPWRVFKVICFTIGFVTLCAAAAFLIYFYNFFDSLPKIDRMTFDDFKASANQYITHKLENKGKHFRWVPINKMSRELVFSIVLSEDATFFEHDGFNVSAIADAMAENLKERKFAFGGSTISQQVVKNVFLDERKTLSRKIQELLITWKVEEHFSKNEILEVYLNIAEFGPDIFGVNAASNRFFKRIPSEVNAAEGAFMALMLPSPRRFYFSIIENKNLTQKKRKKIDRILRDMFYNEFITAEQYQKYIRYRFFDELGRMPARSHR